MDDCKIAFDFNSREYFEDEEESPSYPGVRTVYRKEIFEGKVTTTDAGALGRIGAKGGKGEWSKEDSKNYTRVFSWLTEQQCVSGGIKHRAPKEGAEVSALVHPPVGFEEEELSSLLTA